VTAVRAVLTMEVAPQDASAFEREWLRVAQWAGGQPGCLGQSLCRGGAPDRVVYVIASDWIDAAAFTVFERSAEQDRVTGELRRLRRSARMEVLTVINCFGG
jgi:heme-degrading monooxygenase HmoA